MKRTKIICTIGPATESVEKIEALAKAGMNAARLNFSHGSYKHHSLLINNIRQVRKSLGAPLAIIQDLQGPRLRLGTLPQDGVAVKRGDIIGLYPENKKPMRLPPGVIGLAAQTPIDKIVKRGEIILIKDGLVKLRVQEIKNGIVLARVEQGDILTSNRGLNLPESKLPRAVLTAKDKADIKFGLKKKVDWFALSFVRNRQDVAALRRLLPKNREYQPKIIAKIECHEAVANFDEILSSSDAIMIARGDLGIELPSEQVPLLQKQFITKCLSAAKPVIVATQMLESMAVNPRPTRAEVSDVANAVIDHTDAVMLSAETSTGKYPLQACRMMATILKETEASRYDDLAKKEPAAILVPSIIAHTAEEVAGHDHIDAIVVMSSSGTSARLLSSERPEAPIIALTQNEITRRQMALSWGVEPYLMKRYGNLDDLIKAAVSLVKKELKIKPGGKILIASGHPTGPHGQLNLLKIHTI